MRYVAVTRNGLGGRRGYSCLDAEGKPNGSLGGSNRPSDAAEFSSYIDALSSAAHATRMYTYQYQVIVRITAPSQQCPP